MARFEVLGLEADRELIRSLARWLATDGAGVMQTRTALRQTISGEKPTKGGILAAFRRPPLVGANLEVFRSFTTGRDVAL